MLNNFRSEIAVSIILIALLLLLINPFDFWMPDAFAMMLIVGLVILFGLFSGLVWREQARDEREALHRMLAGRFAYIVGTTTLVIGITVQSLAHAIDPWLVVTLGVMILAKVVGSSYGNHSY